MAYENNEVMENTTPASAPEAAPAEASEAPAASTEERSERSEERPERSEAPARRRMPRRRRKVCVFCGKDNFVDYKDAAKMRKYVSERGKILPRRVTGNCAKHQRAVTLAIKRARHLAILPYVDD